MIHVVCIDPSYKSHNAPVLNPTMHHFVNEMCTCVLISVTNWSIVGYLSNALWNLWDGKHEGRHEATYLIWSDVSHMAMPWLFSGLHSIPWPFTASGHQQAQYWPVYFKHSKVSMGRVKSFQCTEGTISSTFAYFIICLVNLFFLCRDMLYWRFCRRGSEKYYHHTDLNILPLTSILDTSEHHETGWLPPILRKPMCSYIINLLLATFSLTPVIHVLGEGLTISS